MKLMDKYILRQYLAPLIYCLIAFSMIQVIYDLFDHLSKFIIAETPVLTIGRYYFLLLLPTLEYLMPASLLLATLYTLWRLTRRNELTTMRASGVSLYRIMLPFLVVGMVFSIFAIVIKEVLAPRASQWTDDFVDNGYREPKPKVYHDQPYINTSARHVWMIGKLDLKNPHHLVDVTVKQEREDHSKSREYFAEKAEWLDGQWWFYNGKIQEFNKDEGPCAKPRLLGPLGTEIPELFEIPSDIINDIKPWKYFSSLEMLNYLEKKRSDLSDDAIAQKKFDIHSRMALPWACLIVTLFGIPAGAKTGRQGAIAGIFLAIACFLGFYALTQVGFFLGRKLIIWPWLGAWLSNIIFLITGIKMIVRMR